MGAPTLVREDAAAFVRRSRAEPGKDIVVMSGGDLAGALLEGGAIDEVGMNVHPLLLGGGVPAVVGRGARVPLTLQAARPLDGGCVRLRYAVTRAR